jgi:hypothetical protein
MKNNGTTQNWIKSERNQRVITPRTVRALKSSAENRMPLIQTKSEKRPNIVAVNGARQIPVTEMR